MLYTILKFIHTNFRIIIYYRRKAISFCMLNVLKTAIVLFYWEVIYLIDILKILCKNLNIKLSYTNNKVVILSCNCRNKNPSLRVHSIFNGCNDEVAYAIINYYTKAEKREESLKILNKYAHKNFHSQIYKINPSSDEFCNEVVKIIIAEDFKQNENSPLIELTISSIIRKDFCGDEYAVNPSKSFKVTDEGIAELNITIGPFNT